MAGAARAAPGLADAFRGGKLPAGDEIIQRHIKKAGQGDKGIQIRCAAGLLIHAHCAGTDVQGFGKLGLG